MNGTLNGTPSGSANGKLHKGAGRFAGTAVVRLRAARRLAARRAGSLRRGVRGHARDAGMSTAEYAVGTIAACAFAAVLYKVVTSGPVSEALQQLVERALDATF